MTILIVRVQRVFLTLCLCVVWVGMALGDSNAEAVDLFACYANKDYSCLTQVGKQVGFDQRDEQGQTLLLIAVGQNDLKLAQFLLEQGADPNLSMHHRFQILTGATPLMMAVQQNNARMVELLLRHEANPRQSTQDGISPLLLATLNGHLKNIQQLRQAGALISTDPNDLVVRLGQMHPNPEVNELFQTQPAADHSQYQQLIAPECPEDWKPSLIELLINHPSFAQINCHQRKPPWYKIEKKVFFELSARRFNQPEQKPVQVVSGECEVEWRETILGFLIKHPDFKSIHCDQEGMNWFKQKDSSSVRITLEYHESLALPSVSYRSQEDSYAAALDQTLEKFVRFGHAKSYELKGTGESTKAKSVW